MLKIQQWVRHNMIMLYNSFLPGQVLSSVSLQSCIRPLINQRVRSLIHLLIFSRSQLCGGCPQKSNNILIDTCEWRVWARLYVSVVLTHLERWVCLWRLWVCGRCELFFWMTFRSVVMKHHRKVTSLKTPLLWFFFTKCKSVQKLCKSYYSFYNPILP